MSDGPLGSEFTKVKGYEYRSNANLVLQGVDRRSKVSKEPTGEAESLRGRLVHQMGDRAQVSRPRSDAGDKKKAAKKRRAEGAPSSRAAKRARTGSVLDQDGTPRPALPCP